MYYGKRNNADLTWWYLPPETIVDFLNVLGFEEVEITYHQQLWNDKEARRYVEISFYTVVDIENEFQRVCSCTGNNLQGFL
jgi:hypothetical protein